MMSRIIATLCMMGLVSSFNVDEVSNYCAEIVGTEANGAVGYFAMQIFEGSATYSYQLDLSSFTLKTCNLDNGLKYHIHSYWLSDESQSASGPDKCGPAVTGGHYDPNLACGYESKYCTALDRPIANYSCTPAKYKDGRLESCQIGDLSGKFDLAKGPIVFSQSLLRDYQPPYASNFLAPNKNKDVWSSIVFHCSDEKRLVCAKFKLITDTTQSLCSFPPSSTSVIQTLQSKVKRGNTNLIVLGVAMFAFFIIYTTVIALVWWRQSNIRKKLADSDFITL